MLTPGAGEGPNEKNAPSDPSGWGALTETEGALYAGTASRGGETRSPLSGRTPGSNGPAGWIGGAGYDPGSTAVLGLA